MNQNVTQAREAYDLERLEALCQELQRALELLTIDYLQSLEAQEKLKRQAQAAWFGLEIDP